MEFVQTSTDIYLLCVKPEMDGNKATTDILLLLRNGIIYCMCYERSKVLLGLRILFVIGALYTYAPCIYILLITDAVPLRHKYTYYD